MTKLTNIQFRTPVRLPGSLGLTETLLETSGHVEVLDFPWARIVTPKGNRRTTIFNIAGCDDWKDEEPEPPKGKAGK